MNSAAKTSRREIDERQRRDCDNRQNRICNKQNRRDGNNLNHVRHRDRNHHDEALNLHQIARRATHQLTSLCFVVIIDVQVEHMTKKFFAQQGFSPTALAKCDIPTKPRQDAGQHTETSDDQRPLQQRTIFFDAIVDRQLCNLRNRHFERGP